MASTVEMQKDVEELQKLVGEASRSRVKDLLNLEIRRLQTEILKREEQAKAVTNSGDQQDETSKASSSAAFGSTTPQVYNELIKSYAWDQSDKYMKLYVTLKGVHNADKSAVTSRFTPRSMTLEVKGVNGRNSDLSIVRLAEYIDPEASYHKVKTDMVLIMLKKKEVGKTWTNVTEQEKKTKEKKRSAPMDEDPGTGLMNMLKNMYDEGDDELKRTISKAFYDSQNKQATDGLGDMRL